MGVERLTALAKQQRNELMVVRKHSHTVQEYALECERRLKQCFSRTKSLHAVLHGVDGLGDDGGPSFGGSSSGFSGSRQASAPTLLSPGATKLPSVAKQGRSF